MENIIIRDIDISESADELELAWKVFLEFEAPDYSKEGIDEFYKSIHDPEYLAMLKCFGAFDGERIVGMIATRSSGHHIALFFVDGRYHRRGIGKKLFLRAVSDVTGKITVNSSPYAVEIYRKLGFESTDNEQVTNGLRYTPMEMVK